MKHSLNQYDTFQIIVKSSLSYLKTVFSQVKFLYTFYHRNALNGMFLAVTYITHFMKKGGYKGFKETIQLSLYKQK